MDDAYAESKKRTIADMFKISLEEAGYLMSIDTIQKDMYDVNEDQITILFKDNTTKDISESSELLNIALLSKKSENIIYVINVLNKFIYLCR